MKSTTLLAAALATFSLQAHAGGVVFEAPVTYTEPVTYAAGVTYLAPVTYAPTAAKPVPVVLERVVVTPKRRYTEQEWQVAQANQRKGAALYTVSGERRADLPRSSGAQALVLAAPAPLAGANTASPPERRYEARTPALLRVLLAQ